ncbi:hypothetical protein [Geitlerinema sp. PCC 9228]|uniref:hypothetical protein n=1 Tax=Geitlerinema sp. PCC 9228 TaxID=111611 RepID=UPI001114FABB|nr:hypothetical protein [Geitlerinema sp. PCC 9228]
MTTILIARSQSVSQKENRIILSVRAFLPPLGRKLPIATHCNPDLQTVSIAGYQLFDCGSVSRFPTSSYILGHGGAPWGKTIAGQPTTYPI